MDRLPPHFCETPGNCHCFRNSELDNRFAFGRNEQHEVSRF